MVAELVNLRKLILPVAVLGLAFIFGVNIQYWNGHESFYNDMLRTDNYAVAFSGLGLLIGMFILMLSSEFYKNDEKHISDYASLIIFIICGALMMFSFSNLAMLFIGLETLSIALYVLTGSRRFDIKSNEAGFKYFLMGSFASGFLMFGIALIYGVTGTFNVQAISEFVINNLGNISPLFYVGMVLIVFAMLFKISAAPFHFWAPDVYEGAPTLITALMSTLVKVAAFAAFYRLLSMCFVFTMDKAELILTISAVITLFVGNLVALAQDNFKRLLAYSGISHAGYLLLAVLSLKAGTESALFYYLLAYSLATIAAFAVALVVFEKMGTEEIRGFNGLGKKNPVLAAALSMAMLSLAGIPPFAGFFGKYYIFTEALQAGHFWLVLIAVINSIIGVYYYFKVIIAMYGKPSSEVEVSAPMVNNLVIWVCIVASILIGIFPDHIVSLL